MGFYNCGMVWLDLALLGLCNCCLVCIQSTVVYCGVMTVYVVYFTKFTLSHYQSLQEVFWQSSCLSSCLSSWHDMHLSGHVHYGMVITK